MIFFFVSVGPAIFTSFAFVEIARHEEEVDEKQDKHELRDEPDEIRRRPVQR